MKKLSMVLLAVSVFPHASSAYPVGVDAAAIIMDGEVISVQLAAGSDWRLMVKHEGVLYLCAAAAREGGSAAALCLPVE